MLSSSYPPLDFLVPLCGALLLCYLFHAKIQTATRPPLPPGPKPLPFIGNVMDMPNDKIWETHNRWAEKYGDVVHVSFFGKHVVILNSFKVVNDLLDRKSSIYSSRPYLTMTHELVPLGGSTGLLPYGKLWRKHRLLYHKQMNQTAVTDFQPLQLAAARELLRLTLDFPEDYVKHIRHMIASITLGIAYGRETSPQVDPLIAKSIEAMAVFSDVIRPGAYLVNVFPILKHVPAWVPGAGFKKRAQEMRKTLQYVGDVPFREVKAHVSAGSARHSFVANALIDIGINDESNEDVNVVKRVATGTFIAGTDSTTSSIHSFILAMVLYPDIQKKAQAELDSVVGNGRLPEFKDRQYLPYLGAIVKEVLRWFPVFPTTIPHVTTEDDVYEGYNIPINSTVLVNSWRLSHDPEMYPNPLTFSPERFLPDKNGHVARDPAIGGAFGFGRRACPGRHLADTSIWIAAASLLSAFDMSNAVDDDGRRIDVNYARDPTSSFFSRPRPFKCSIIPRSSNAETMIRCTE